ncbi:hypothetical protein PMAYCL1PPCAC_09801, partial [Pristionchus mayeri]
MKLRYEGVVSTYLVFGSVTVAVITSLIVFIFLPALSNYIYNRALARGERYNESLRRYQARENCLSAPLLKRVVILHVSISPIAIVGYFYIKTNHPESTTLMGQ